MVKKDKSELYARVKLLTSINYCNFDSINDRVFEFEVKKGDVGAAKKTLANAKELAIIHQRLMDHLSPHQDATRKRGKYNVRTLQTYLNRNLTDEQQKAGITLLISLLKEHNHLKGRANNRLTAHELYYIVQIAVESGLLTEMPDTLYACLKNSGIEINCPKNTFNDNVPPLKSLDDNKKLYTKLKEEIASRLDDIVGGNK